MMQNRLNAVRSITVEPDVIVTTLRALQHFGEHGCEGLVLWLGHVSGERGCVIKAVVPDQRPIKNEGGVGYFIESATLFELNRELAASGLRLIAQVHSHPDEAYHSDTDDRYAIVTADGGLSL